MNEYSKSNKLLFLFMYILSCWSIGIGLRFLFSSGFYEINIFDKVFDWFMLFISGIIVFILLVKQLYGVMYEKEKNVDN